VVVTTKLPTEPATKASAMASRKLRRLWMMKSGSYVLTLAIGWSSQIYLRRQSVAFGASLKPGLIVSDQGRKFLSVGFI